MKIKLAMPLLCLAVGSLYAQKPSLRIDLSGPWHMLAEDDPSFARPGFDDSPWKIVQAPFQPERPIGYWWLRHTVTLPDWLALDTELALTAGALNEVYEVFVNGERIAMVGGPRLSQMFMARRRIFRSPALRGQPGQRLTIALRLWTVPGYWPQPMGVSESFPDTGPWLLTSADNAPTALTEAPTAIRQNFGVTALIFSEFWAVLALLLIVAWVSQRNRSDLLMFASYLLVEALTSGSTWYCVVRDRPFLDTFVGGMGLALGTLCLSYFARASLAGSWRWALILAWASFGMLAIINSRIILRDGSLLPSFSYAVFPSYAWATVFAALTIAAIIVGAIRSGRQALRQSDREQTLLAIAVGTLPILATVRIFVPVRLPGTSLGVYPLAISALAVWLTLTLLRSLGAARQRLRQELQAARIVQNVLLPPSAGAGVDAAYLPALEVGGDFWQSIPLDDGGLLLAIGDVSGKGVPAAMVVAMLVGAVRMRRDLQPAQLLSELNRILQKGSGFVTCCAIRLSSDGATATIANAGHCPPYLGGREVELPPGLPLGIDPEVQYAETTLQLTSADQITLISDGVPEAANARRELFGFDRTAALSMRPAAELAEAAKAWVQNDDITVVTVRRLG